MYLSVINFNLEGIDSFKLSFSSQIDYLAFSVFTDTLLHAAGFIANLAVRFDEIGICARVESVEISYRDIDYANSFTVYCSLLEIKDAILADAIALNAFGKVVVVVRDMKFKRLQLSAFQQVLSRKFTVIESRNFPVKQKKSQLSTGLNTPLTSDEIIDTFIKSRDSLSHDVRIALKNIVMKFDSFFEQDMNYTNSLDELGIHSLMQIEIISKLIRTFPDQAGLNHYALSECETLEFLKSTLAFILQFSMKITSLVETFIFASQRDSRQSTLVPSDFSSSDDMQKNSVALHVSHEEIASLCLFHDDSEQISMYARLRDHDRSAYVFFDPHFESDKRSHSSINQMIEYYVSLLSRSKLSLLIVSDKFDARLLLNLTDDLRLVFWRNSDLRGDSTAHGQ